MNFIVIKPGAGFPTLRPAGVRIMQALQEAADTYRVDLIITSGSEARGRKLDDPHMTGEAVDVGVNHLSPSYIRNIYDFLRTRLGVAFTVLYECPPGYEPDPYLVAANMVYSSPGATAPHFHIQRRKGTVYPPPSGAVLALVLIAVLLAPGLAAAQERLNMTPAITLAATALLDTGTTYLGVERGCLSGERNPTFWIAGNYKQPNYRKMMVYNAVGVGALAGVKWITGRGRQARPDSATRRWLDRGVSAYLYGLSGYRGFAAGRNIVRCAQ